MPEATSLPVPPNKKQKISYYSFDYWYLQYCLTTGLYMLEPWERKLFNTVVIATFSIVALVLYPVMSDSAKPSKVSLHLKAVGDAPIMKQKNWDVDGARTVVWLVTFIKKYLQLKPTDSLFLFINQSFSPSPDHTLFNLQQCFAPSDGKLVIHYSTTNAWG